MRSEIFESYTSDSDIVEDLVSGNVSKLGFKHPGKNLKVKKGLLVFDACFESGNLGKVEIINEHEYDLHIRSDTCNPKYRVWFNFTVENSIHEQRVIFNIVNFSKTKSLYREGMSPLVRSSSRPNWTRIPHKNVFYYRCPEHKRNYVMSFAFCFDRDDDIYQFCYCYPYTYARLQVYLEEIGMCKYPYFRREIVGMSVQKRRIDLITITHPENITPNEDMKRRTVFVTARVHPGETPSSFVCQGFIDFMVSDHPLAQELRYHLIFKIVPMLNPDGVFLGNYRCSLLGFDLNRQWSNPSQLAHPEIYATKQLLMKLNGSKSMDVNFFVDIHAHSTLMNGFMYGNVFEDEERAGRQAVFPNLLSRFAEDFSLHQTNFNRDSVKAGTGRRTLGGILDDHTLCYTLEVSFFSYTNAKTGETVPYNEAKYARLGRNLARTFHEYYANEGLFSKFGTLPSIPNDPTSSRLGDGYEDKAAKRPPDANACSDRGDKPTPTFKPGDHAQLSVPDTAAGEGDTMNSISDRMVNSQLCSGTNWQFSSQRKPVNERHGLRNEDSTF